VIVCSFATGFFFQSESCATTWRGSASHKTKTQTCRLDRRIASPAVCSVLRVSSGVSPFLLQLCFSSLLLSPACVLGFFGLYGGPSAAERLQLSPRGAHE
jgi:hypothetical protein